jgi:hypothetical protein
MSGADDRPGDRNERLACRRLCDGERGREGLEETVATCRASSSIRAVKILISPGEDTPATQGGVSRYFICHLGHIF